MNLLSGRKKSSSGKQPTKDQRGNSVALPGELAAAWAEFCEAKFAGTARERSRQAAPTLSPASTRASDVPSEEELNLCLAALAKRRATGWDGIPVEAYRASPAAKADLFTLIRRMWREEAIPEDLATCELVTILKNKGSPDDFTKYRCIGLLTHAYKILSTLLLKRMVTEVEDFLPESQAGFRKF